MTGTERSEQRDDNSVWENVIAIRLPEEVHQDLEDLRRISGAESKAQVICVGSDWLKWLTILAASGYDLAILHNDGRRETISNEALREKLIPHPENIPPKWNLNGQ